MTTQRVRSSVDTEGPARSGKGRLGKLFGRRAGAGGGPDLPPEPSSVTVRPAPAQEVPTAAKSATPTKPATTAAKPAKAGPAKAVKAARAVAACRREHQHAPFIAQ